MVFTTFDWVMILALVTTLIGLALFIMNEIKFKHKVIIREVTNNRRIIRFDRAKDYQDVDGVKYWKLKKERDKIKKLIPTPPSESIELTHRGKKLVEVYRTEEGEYVYIKDTNKDIQSLQPLTRNDRMTLIHSYKTAEFKNKKNLIETIKDVAVVGGIVMVIAMALIFGPDIITSYTKGATQISGSLEAYEKIRHDNLMIEMEQWERIAQGIQQIDNEQKKIEKRMTDIEKKNEQSK